MTLSASPWIAVLQQPTRTNTSLTAAANKLTLDLDGGTYVIAPYFVSPSIRGGRVSVYDKFGTGAYLKIANGTLNNDTNSNSLTTVGDAGAAGRLFVQNGTFKASSMTLGSAANSPGFLTLESGGQLVVSNALRVGSLAGGNVVLSAENTSLTAARVFIGETGVVGVVTLDSPDAVFHAKTVGVGTGELRIDNARPALPGGNVGLVVNAGSVLVDGKLVLAKSAAQRYGAVAINGGSVSVAGAVEFGPELTDTSGGKIFLNDGRFQVASPIAFQPSSEKNFYWREGTLAFSGATTTIIDADLKKYTRQGAISYGGDRAEGTLATGQTLDAAGTLTMNGGAVGLAGGTIRAAGGLVLNSSVAGYGTLDAVVSGGGSISNASTNDLVIGGLNGSNAISSSGDLIVGHRGDAATFAGSSSGGGAFVKNGGGTQSVTGSVTNTGGVNVAAGELSFAGAGQRLQTSSVAVSDAAVLRFSDGVVGNADTATIGVSPAAQSRGRLEIVGTGSTFNVTGDLTNGGFIELTGGTLSVGGTLVNHGQLINNGTLVATVNGSGVLSGSGSFAGPVVVGSGAMLAPGNSPGTTTFADLSFASGGFFELEIANAAGVAGSEWDLASVSGLLSIAASSADPYTILLKSLDASFAAGALAGFDAENTWSWKFVSAAILDPTSIAADAFLIDATEFVAWNDVADGSFSVVAATDGLYVSFAPQPASVPEPNSLLLLSATGLVGFGLKRRRLRKLGLQVSNRSHLNALPLCRSGS